MQCQMGSISQTFQPLTGMVTAYCSAIANNQTECVAWLKANGARAATNTGYVKDRDILQAARWKFGRSSGDYASWQEAGNYEE